MNISIILMFLTGVSGIIVLLCINGLRTRNKALNKELNSLVTKLIDKERTTKTLNVTIARMKETVNSQRKIIASLVTRGK